MLRKITEDTGLSAVGRKRVLLIHYYRDAVVATALRYRDEVTDPSRLAELKDLPEAGEEEQALWERRQIPQSDF